MASIVGGVVCAIVGAVIWWLSEQFPPAPSVASDPALLPTSVGVLLTVCGVAMALVPLVRNKLAPATSSAAAASTPTTETTAATPSTARAAAGIPAGAGTTPQPNERNLGVVAGFVIGFCLYAWLAIRVGYVTMTTLFMTGAVVLLGAKRSWRSIAFAAVLGVAFTFLVLWVFSDLLRVPMPRTPLP